MDFFASQERARRKTGILVVYFLLAVALITLAIYFVAILVSALLGAKLQGASAPAFRPWNPALMAISAGATLTVILCGSLFEILRLGRGGGATVAARLGGRPVQPNTINPGERRLLNVVEEMAIAAGVPMPPVYILEGEDGINAFAAGYHPSDAVIGVTKGTVELLSRDELQGVIGHEFSHILNGDMRLNLHLMGILFGILMLAIIGQTLVRVLGRGRVRTRGKGGGAVVAVFLAGLGLMIVGHLGVFFGRLIKAAISRQREYLADAASVQFTRNPDGLAGALRKIGGLFRGALIQTPRAEDASHMFFGQARRMAFAGMMATHPPLDDRIRRIDPAFNGEFPRVEPLQARRTGRPAAAGDGATVARLAGTAAPPRLPRAPIDVRPDEIMASIGAPMQRHMTSARSILAALPVEVREASRDPLRACALIYALLLDADEAIRRGQLERLEREADRNVVAETKQLTGPIGEVGDASRLPLLDLCIPALKTLSERQYRTFKANVEALAAADEEIDLFEYTLLHSLVRNLDAHFVKPRTTVAQIYAVRGLAHECSVLLSTLARIGHDDEGAARAAFEGGAAALRDPKARIVFAPADGSTLAEVDACLDRLSLASPKIKKWIVVACLKCLVHDNKVTADEAALFRAVSYALDVPVPFFCGIAV